MDINMEAAIIILLAVLIICVMCVLVLVIKNGSHTDDSARVFSEVISENQKSIGTMQSERFTHMDGELKAMRRSIDAHLAEIYRSMGDISSLTSGVNDLRRVLTNVKTRGILGEIQLGAILEEILAPEQYDANVATIPGSRNVVEFAVKLPHEEEGFVYLPIDSKFPLDAYSALLDAYDEDDTAAVEAAAKILVQRIKLFAKDIHTKYVEPPYTTDFAVMFLPTESLYLEAVKRGLIETLQRDYKICLAGPSTMAALLNSLQMGFRTLALEKRASEVWRVLGEVKSEFEKFGGVLENMQKHVNAVSNDLENLTGVRMRAMERKLRDVEKMEREEQ